MIWIFALIIIFLGFKIFSQTKEIDGLKQDIARMFVLVERTEEEREQAPPPPQPTVAPPYRNGAHAPLSSAQADPRGRPGEKPQAQQPQQPQLQNSLSVPAEGGGGGGAGVSLEDLAKPNPNLEQFFR